MGISLILFAWESEVRGGGGESGEEGRGEGREVEEREEGMEMVIKREQGRTGGNRLKGKKGQRKRKN